MINRIIVLFVLVPIIVLAACAPQQTAMNDEGHVTFRDRLYSPESIRNRFGILELNCYVWTDRMPSPSPSASEGSPLYVALRLTLDPARARGDSLHVLSMYGPLGLLMAHADTMYFTVNQRKDGFTWMFIHHFPSSLDVLYESSPKD